jgi:DNA polymerase-3 subunit beta
MKVLCNREKLHEALALANGVIPTRSTKPVLENVCLVAKDDAVEVVGTDLEVAFRYRIEHEVSIEETGTAVIPARVTADFVRDLTGDQLTLAVRDGTCTITSGADHCELVTVDPDEFPSVSRFEGKGDFSMQGGVFTQLVGKTAFAAAKDAGRYAMHGILTEIADGQLRMVATDGRRMALATSPVDCSRPPAPVIVPTKGMQFFCRAIQDPLDQVALHFTETQLGMRTKNAEIFVRLIDGDFPRYAAVIPAQTRNTLEADTDLLSRKLRLVANVTGEDARAVRFRLRKGELELFGHSAGRGEANARMDVDYKGEDAEIAFNPDYFLDGVKNCETSVVRLEFNDKTSPGKLDLGENYIYVVMPITVDA